MDRSFRNFTAACIGTFLLLGVVTTGASANYTGLADDEPGPADVWAATHPDFGRVTHDRSGLESHAVQKLIPDGKCQYFHEKAVQTGIPRWWQRYRECENG